MTTEITDTASLLWDFYYKVRIPYLQSRSIEDIRRTGVVVTGIPDLDNDIQNQWLTTMMPIYKMANYYKEGVPIKVCYASDIKTIYEHISHHIHAWKQRLERGINIGEAPIDDLIVLDKFANTIYEHAKYQFTPEIVNSLLAQYMNSVQRVNASNFFNPTLLQKLNDVDYGSNVTQIEPGVTRINSDEPEQTYPERDSLQEFFKNRIISLRRY